MEKKQEEGVKLRRIEGYRRWKIFSKVEQKREFKVDVVDMEMGE